MLCVGISNVISLLSGIALFLFGMALMGDGLKQVAGNKLELILYRLTGNPIKGFLLGAGVTAVIQSSSATSVMIVGFVNSGMMKVRQAISIVLGAILGTSITGWIICLSDIGSTGGWLDLFSTATLTGVISVIGIVLRMAAKDPAKKHIGDILMGFAVLMFGMSTMSAAVSPLREDPTFIRILTSFSNPFLGILFGTLFTCVLQSASAAVGILQALSATGAVSYAAAIPIIMGQNIGTTVTALLSSIGTNKNARRAAVVHLMFNVIGVVVLLTVFTVVRAALAPALLDEAATRSGIAIAHSAFNLLCTAMLLPAGGLLEKLAIRIVPDSGEKEQRVELDERLLATPALALSRSRAVAADMAEHAVRALKDSLTAIDSCSPALAERIRQDEELCDHYEDILSTYLVKLSAEQMGTAESEEAAALLKSIGDFERISDHAVNTLESAEELRDKNLTFSPSAVAEFSVLSGAVSEILDLSLTCFEKNDSSIAAEVEPLEQVIDQLKESMRTRHIRRLQQGGCSIELGFILSDLLTGLERTSDHCSNIAGCVIDTAQHNLNLHESLRATRLESSDFIREFNRYARKYALPASAAVTD